MKKITFILGMFTLIITGSAYGKHQQTIQAASLITATHTKKSNKLRGQSYFLAGKALATKASKLQYTDPAAARRVAHKAVTAFDKAIRLRKNTDADKQARELRTQTWAFIRQTR